MNYQEAMNYLEQVSHYESTMGLEAIRELLNRLNNPQDKLSYIHVTGTNGKGSTSAYISYILAEAGYKVGRYSSPAVFTYWERIQITDQYKTAMISETSVSRNVAKIKIAADSMVIDGLKHPSIFEIETVLAFLEFVEQDCNIVVLEVGLGGRLDATNIIKNTVCAVFTSISKDHTQYLGDTLEQIAYEKAGIMKANCMVVSYDQVEAVKHVLEKVAYQKQAKLSYADFSKISHVSHNIDGITMDYDKFIGITTKLLGEHQVNNVAVAIKTAMVLQEAGYPITDEMIYSGIQKTVWSGRLEIIHLNPVYLIDGAHNEAAALSLANSIRIYFKDKRIRFIIGVLADKEYDKILAHTSNLAYDIYTITPDTIRALDSWKLAEIAKRYNENVIDAKTVEEAIKQIKDTELPEDVIISFGSLSFLSEVVKSVNQCYNADNS